MISRFSAVKRIQFTRALAHEKHLSRCIYFYTASLLKCLKSYSDSEPMCVALTLWHWCSLGARTELLREFSHCQLRDLSIIRGIRCFDPWSHWSPWSHFKICNPFETPNSGKIRNCIEMYWNSFQYKLVFWPIEYPKPPLCLVASESWRVPWTRSEDGNLGPDRIRKITSCSLNVSHSSRICLSTMWDYVHYALHVESWVDSMFPMACHVCFRLLWGFNGNMPVKDHLTSARTSDGTSSPTLGLFTFRNYRNSMRGWQHEKVHKRKRVNR